MPKITDEQKQEFYKLYKKGFRCHAISKAVGVSLSFAKRVVWSFDAGDFSWLESNFVHHSKAITEEGKKMIVRELLETEIPWAEAVAEYGFPENTLRMWKRNYTEYGVCSRRCGRPPKESSNDKRAEEDQGAGRREHYLQDILPGLRGKRDGSAKKRLYERLANAEDLEFLSSDALKCSD